MLNHSGEAMFRESMFRIKVIRALIAIAVLVPMLALRVPARADTDPCPATDTPGCSYELPTFQYQLLLSDMLAHPSPNVRPLQVDTNELNKFAFYKLIGGATPLYNGPGGS